MNSKNGLPKGYKSLQDFLLHYHKYSYMSPSSENNSSKSINSANLKNIKPPECTAENFKTQITMSQVPEESPETISLRGRNFYERSSKSDINPLLLMDPSEVAF